MIIAAWMQPLRYDLQSSAAKDNSITHAAAAASNLDAAIPMRSATGDSKTPYNYAHTSRPKAASSHHYTAARKKANRPQPQPPHRRGTFHRRLQPLYTEKHKVSCFGFLPETERMQHHAAIPMRSERTDSKTSITTHAQAHPKQLEATVTIRPKKRQTDRSRNRRTDEVPFIAGCSHFTRKNTRFRAPASSPKQSPCNIMQPFQCDLQAQIPKHPITTHTQAHPTQLEATVTMRQKKGKPTAAATAAQTRYLSSPAAATLHGKTQGFVLRLPPENRAHATSCSHYNAI